MESHKSRACEVSEASVIYTKDEDNIEAFSKNIFGPCPKKVMMRKHAYTFAIVPWRRVKYNKKYKAFKDYTQDEQKHILNDAIHYNIPDVHHYHAYACEPTQQGNIHAHGIIDCTDDDIYLMQSRLHNIYGYKKDDPERLFKVVPVYDTEHWESYMLKNI